MPAAFSLLLVTEAPSTLRKVETLPPPTSSYVLDNGCGPGIGTRRFRQQSTRGTWRWKDHFLWLERGLFGASRKEVKAQSQLESTSEFAAV